jgi:uncharacterized membrane protein YhaH (DUF805 family)
MTRHELFTNWTHLFLDPHGRIGRRDFWLGSAVLLVVGNLLHIILFFGSLASFGLFYCWVCLFSKRLHDLGKSGWIQIVPHVINAVCILVGIFLGALGLIAALLGGRPLAMAGALMGTTWAGILLFVLGVAGVNTLIFMLWTGLSRGQAGANLYGAPQESLIHRPHFHAHPPAPQP